MVLSSVQLRNWSTSSSLQGPDLGQVLFLSRLEDPAPQPPYVVLVQPPVDGVPLQGRVLGSVHHHGRLTCPSVPAYPALCLKGSPATRQPAFAAGHQARYPASYTDSTRLEDRSRRLRFPAAFRPPAFASWASCSRQETGLTTVS